MYLLDTNHLTILQRGGKAAKPLETKLAKVDPNQIATTIVSYHEQTQGWLREANRFAQSNLDKQVKIYGDLEVSLQFFANIPVVGFDRAAAQKLQELRRLYRQGGAMDLRIAAIALTQNATVLTQNLRDFTHILNLQAEDWSY
jgi:tRNA(fMet)-specific endonuclease VapC